MNNRFSILLLFITAVILLFLGLNSYFNFDFVTNYFPPYPYDPSIWGNVADWMIVIVTTITAYFLYKTLQSQIDAQAGQRKSLEKQTEALLLEQKKYKAAIQPLFSGSYRTSSNDFLSLACKFRNGLARKAKITFKNIPGHHSFIIRSPEVIVGYGTQMLGNLLAEDEFLLNFRLVPGQAEYNIQFFMVYHDATGENGYIQQIRYMHSTQKFTYGEIREYIQGKTLIPSEFEVMGYL